MLTLLPFDLRPLAAKLAATLVLASLAGSPALATTNVFFASPDTPARLGSADYLASDIVRVDGNAYALELALPTDARTDALQGRPSGWLFSLEAASELEGTLYDPRDVIAYEGAGFSLYLDGAAAGIPAGANVDAIALRGSANAPLLLSLDAPATIGGVETEPGDVLRWAGGTLSLFLDASAMSPPVPAGVNLVALDENLDGLYLSWDVPVRLDGELYLPGDVVRYDDPGFTLKRRGSDQGWGIEHPFAGFSAPTEPGTIATLEVRKRPNGDLEFFWTASCSSWATNSALYGGPLAGDFAAHTPITCFDAGGDRREVYTPRTRNSEYFLVVPLTQSAEGSYGFDSAGNQRARGTSTCRAEQGLPVCP